MDGFLRDLRFTIRNMTSRDPLTLAFTGCGLIAVASLAGYLPSRRATLVDPARALKSE